MTAVNLTEAEHAEAFANLDVADPPVFSTRQVGFGPIRPKIVDSWSHDGGDPEACGVTVQTLGTRDENGDVELTEQVALGLLDQNGTVELAQKLVDAFEPEESTREFDLEWDFSECGGDWHPNG